MAASAGSTDTLGYDIRWLNPAYQQAVEEYRRGLENELEGEYELPGLVLSDSEEEFDLETNIILLRPGELSRQSLPELAEDLGNRLSEIHSVRFHSEALTRRSESAVQWLEDIYSTSLEFNGAYFRDLPGKTLAKSRWSDREFRIDTDYMSQFDPHRERFETDNPVQSIEEQVERLNTLLEEGRDELEPRVSKVASTPLHEARHWLSYELQPENLEYKKNRPEIEEISGEKRSWGKDVTVAPLEAETTFDQFLYGYNGKKRRKQPLKAFHSPEESPEFFQNHDNLTEAPEKNQITSPYNLGLFLALAEYHRARQDREDTEALREARNYTTDLRKDPEGLQNEVEEYLDWRLEEGLAELETGTGK